MIGPSEMNSLADSNGIAEVEGTLSQNNYRQGFLPRRLSLTHSLFHRVGGFPGWI